MSDVEHDRLEGRRQQVLDAAAECFQRSGFHGASIAQIARTAGMSPGHIYNLFENKDDIIGMIVQRDEAERLAHVDAMRREDDVVRAMIEQADCGVEHQLTSSAALQLEVLAEAGRNPKLAEVVRNGDTIAREKLATLMRAAFAQRGRTCDARDVAARVEALMALFDGLMLRTVRHPDIDRDAVAPVVRRIVAALVDE